MVSLSGCFGSLLPGLRKRRRLLVIGVIHRSGGLRRSSGAGLRVAVGDVGRSGTLLLLLLAARLFGAMLPRPGVTGRLLLVMMMLMLMLMLILRMTVLVVLVTLLLLLVRIAPPQTKLLLVLQSHASSPSVSTAANNYDDYQQDNDTSSDADDDPGVNPPNFVR